VDRCPEMRLTEVTKEDNGYSVTMPIVTVEPYGITTDHSSKARLILVGAQLSFPCPGDVTQFLRGVDTLKK
jgi:hypothetical protein